jgi:hypothetical protein
MSRKNQSFKMALNLENQLVSNFIRLCAAEGVDSETAYRELELRLDALNELRLSMA